MLKKIIILLFFLFTGFTSFTQNVNQKNKKFNFYLYILDSLYKTPKNIEKKTIIKSKISATSLKLTLSQQTEKSRSIFYNIMKNEFNLDSIEIENKKSINLKINPKLFPSKKYIITDTCNNLIRKKSDSGYCPTIYFSDILYFYDKIAIVNFYSVRDYSAIFVFNKVNDSWTYFGTYCESFY